MKILLIIISLITLPNVIYSLNTFDSLFIKDNGITSEVHKNNTGKITFMESIIPVESFTESDFLSSIELLNVKDLNIRVYLKNSLTNELHKLAPELSADELNAKGNYRFEFYVDDNLIYSEDLNPGAGSGESKKVNTVFRIPLISSTGEDSWGRFLWQRFMFKGGEDALTEGTHKLKIIIKPYFKNGSVIYGDVIASGEILLNIKYPEISEAESRIQLISTNSGWETAGDMVDTAIIRDLNTKILQNYFKEITGIAVIKSGELVLEEYFNGCNRDSLHDTRSVGKSFASSLTGIAINDGFIKSENETLNKFYDLKKYDNFSLDKEKVSLKSLLTMSSGFNGSDFDMSSPGNEENMYPAADWVKFALDLPMDSAKTIGKSWDYFTAGVVLLGDILHKSVPNGLEKYSAEKLFQPLEISRYQWEYTPQGVANTAGGLRLRLLDLAKFGWLYNNKGKYKNKQILPEEWVNKSLTNHLQIPGSENEFYGYLFWNMNFNVNGISYEAYYASGNGGNKIFIFKELPLVIVITSTAYNKPYSHRQVNIIMEKYLLPAVVK